jgi:glycosyltransferase involved in cell wall biosynthesis
MELDISVIIPCLNEKDSIGNVIASVVRELQENNFTYEIIVVDNGSHDGSDAIAKNLNSLVLFTRGGTIGRLRNIGANIAKGRLLVFLDADVVVKSPWGKILSTIYQDMITKNNSITGSHPLAPDNIKPLLASWYKGISNDFRNTHLGSGHMIVSTNTYRKIGGFDESLVSGEDYDFCFRAKKIGISVINKPDMVVCHLGYPKTIIEFIKREIWHGEGDFKSFKSILHSRVALCGIVFILGHILLPISFYLYINLFMVLLSIIIVMTLITNIYKFRFDDTRSFIYRSIISYVYLFSRGLSFLFFIYKRLCNISLSK